MPRSTKVFKKRKTCHSFTVSDESRPRPSKQTPTEKAGPKSCSGKKLTPNVNIYCKYDSNTSEYLIIDSCVLKKIISEVAVCLECGGSLELSIERSIGLATELKVTCDSCLFDNRPKKYFTSVLSNKIEAKGVNMYDINLR